MPGIIRRKFLARGDWTPNHRRQLRCGFDREGQRFGSLPCRQRFGPLPPPPDQESAVASAWQDSREGLLAEVDDPKEIWGHCYFDLGQPELYCGTYRPFYE